MSVHLEPSNLEPQRELLSDDISLDQLQLTTETGTGGYPIVEYLTAADLERTIDGSSTVTLTLRDRDRTVLGRLPGQGTPVDIKIDGLWFRLWDRVKQGDDLKLTFIDREIALLKSYPRPGEPHKGFYWWDATTFTRFQVVADLVNGAHGVKEIQIDVHGPDFDGLSPITTINADTPITAAGKVVKKTLGGFAPGAKITVQHQPASPQQRENLALVLSVGLARKDVDRDLLIVAVMVVTQESNATNLLGGDRDSVGLFQQRASQGWPATRDIGTDASAFYDAAVATRKANLLLTLPALASAIQRDYTFGTASQGKDYAQWLSEAKHTVEEYVGKNTDGQLAVDANLGTATSGALGGFNQGIDTPAPGTKVFTRGTVAVVNGRNQWTLESNWKTLQRLAQEVRYRCFVVSGDLYFMSEPQLFQTRPQMTCREHTDGVDSIDFQISQGRQNWQATVASRINRWAAPPGSVVVLDGMGVDASGRWLVTSVKRSLFNRAGTITMKKPIAALPESLSPEGRTTGPLVLQKSGTGKTAASKAAASKAATSEPGTGQPSGKFKVGTALVKPVPKGYLDSQGTVHSTLGLAGKVGPTGTIWPYDDAIDFMAKAGSPVVAPENGTIIKFSGHDPSEGPTIDVHGPFGWSIYLQGASGAIYFLTHLGTRTVTLKAVVAAGQQIATIGDYARWGGADHVHCGVNNDDHNAVSIADLAAAPLAVPA